MNCGGGSSGWSPSVMADGIPGVLTQDEAVAAFRAMLADPDLGVELRMSNVFADDPAATEWRVLASDDSSVFLGLGRWTQRGPEKGAVNYLGMTREGGDWTWSGMGGCRLEPVLDGAAAQWASVSAPEGGLDRSSPAPVIGVSERECTGARDPVVHLHEPYVVELDDSVTVYWTSDAPEGAQACPGNPVVEQTLTLDEPLGDRELLDGSVYPPRPVGRAPA